MFVSTRLSYGSQVFEFLEEVSAGLTDLATEELSVLKGLKVGDDYSMLL